MAFFGAKKPDEKPAGGPNSQAPASLTRVTGASGAQGAVGIDHAIMLMRQLPTDKNVDIVVTVLKATFESLNIRVADIVADAAQRQQQIETRVTQLKTEIAGLEQEVAKRQEEIARMDAALAETTKVKGYLELDAADVLTDAK
jgi:cell division protein FtsB